VYKGISLSTTYDNIRRVKLRKSIFNKNRGTVKLYLKKGLSMNYSLEMVPELEKVYQLILNNLRSNKDL
jgi:hypothetical protein